MKMTRITRCLLVLLLSLGAFAFSPSAPRVQAASGTTAVFRFHGLSAFASFDNVSGCIETTVFVDGSQNTVNNQRTSTADIFIGLFDTCTQTPLLEAIGSTVNPNFQVRKDLTSAALNTTISVTDLVSGNTFNVAVNLTWTSTSATSHELSNFHLHTPGFTENAHFNADFRYATASGTVSDGTTNFTPAQSVFAQTLSAKTGDVTITRS